jgi:elongation factor P--beta-lysine ligase
LDLRNPRILENVIKRHEVTQYIRSFFDQRWFLHVDTPILGKPSMKDLESFIFLVDCILLVFIPYLKHLNNLNNYLCDLE